MIYFVGAGSGAPDLITVRGRRLLQQASLVIYAGSLVNKALLADLPPSTTIVNSAYLTLAEVIDLMVAEEKKAGVTVRLHTGDPSLYGAIREQIDCLRSLDISFEVCPGVSSFAAAAAALGVEYTLPGVSQSLIICRREGRTPVPYGEDIAALASHGASLAIFLSAGDIKGLVADLYRGGLAASTKAALLYKVSWEDEIILRCELQDLAAQAEAHGISKTALILVGGFLGEHYDLSRLYAPDFTTEYRQAKVLPEATPATAAPQPQAQLSPAVSLTQTQSKPPLAILCCSERGWQLGQSIEQQWPGEVSLTRLNSGGLAQWTREQFAASRALLFIAAAGIATRAIAPFVRSKERDPAVLCVDDCGQFVIPLLSGHLGGANELAERLASLLGAQAVITTASDCSSVFALDDWARVQRLSLQPLSAVKGLTAALLAGETLQLHSDQSIRGKPPQGIAVHYEPDLNSAVLPPLESEAAARTVVLSPRVQPAGQYALHLVPRLLTIGLGCRRGTTAAEIKELLTTVLAQLKLRAEAVEAIATIELKAHEEGLLQFCAEAKLPLLLYSAEELAALPGDYTASSFVATITGVDNVCERSAILGSEGGRLLLGKTTAPGLTMAVAQRRSQLSYACRYSN